MTSSPLREDLRRAWAAAVRDSPPTSPSASRKTPNPESGRFVNNTTADDGEILSPTAIRMVVRSSKSDGNDRSKLTPVTSSSEADRTDDVRPPTPPGYFSRLATEPPSQGVPCHWGPCDHSDYRLASPRPRAEDDSLFVSVSQCDVAQMDAEEIPDLDVMSGFQRRQYAGQLKTTIRLLTTECRKYRSGLADLREELKQQTKQNLRLRDANDTWQLKEDEVMRRLDKVTKAEELLMTYRTRVNLKEKVWQEEHEKLKKERLLHLARVEYEKGNHAKMTDYLQQYEAHFPSKMPRRKKMGGDDDEDESDEEAGAPIGLIELCGARQEYLTKKHEAEVVEIRRECEARVEDCRDFYKTMLGTFRKLMEQTHLDMEKTIKLQREEYEREKDQILMSQEKYVLKLEKAFEVELLECHTKHEAYVERTNEMLEDLRMKLIMSKERRQEEVKEAREKAEAAAEEELREREAELLEEREQIIKKLHEKYGKLIEKFEEELQQKDAHFDQYAKTHDVIVRNIRVAAHRQITEAQATSQKTQFLKRITKLENDLSFANRVIASRKYRVTVLERYCKKAHAEVKQRDARYNDLWQKVKSVEKMIYRWAKNTHNLTVGFNDMFVAFRLNVNQFVLILEMIVAYSAQVKCTGEAGLCTKVWQQLATFTLAAHKKYKEVRYQLTRHAILPHIKDVSMAAEMLERIRSPILVKPEADKPVKVPSDDKDIKLDLPQPPPLPTPITESLGWLGETEYIAGATTGKTEEEKDARKVFLKGNSNLRKLERSHVFPKVKPSQYASMDTDDISIEELVGEDYLPSQTPVLTLSQKSAQEPPREPLRAHDDETVTPDTLDPTIASSSLERNQTDTAGTARKSPREPLLTYDNKASTPDMLHPTIVSGNVEWNQTDTSGLNMPDKPKKKKGRAIRTWHAIKKGKALSSMKKRVGNKAATPRNSPREPLLTYDDEASTPDMLNPTIASSSLERNQTDAAGLNMPDKPKKKKGRAIRTWHAIKKGKALSSMKKRVGNKAVVPTERSDQKSSSAVTESLPAYDSEASTPQMLNYSIASNSPDRDPPDIGGMNVSDKPKKKGRAIRTWHAIKKGKAVSSLRKNLGNKAIVASGKSNKISACGVTNPLLNNDSDASTSYMLDSEIASDTLERAPTETAVTNMPDKPTKKKSRAVRTWHAMKKGKAVSSLKKRLGNKPVVASEKSDKKSSSGESEPLLDLDSNASTPPMLDFSIDSDILERDPTNTAGTTMPDKPKGKKGSAVRTWHAIKKGKAMSSLKKRLGS